MRTLILASFIIGACIFSTAHATDVANGTKLYDKKCQGCHDSHIFTRLNRIVHTYEALAARVEFCDNQVKSGFTAGEQSDVTEFLNVKYYKFLKF